MTILCLFSAAGKSTVIKQMRIIHDKEFDDENSRRAWTQSVRENVIEYVRTTSLHPYLTISIGFWNDFFKIRVEIYNLAEKA